MPPLILNDLRLPHPAYCARPARTLERRFAQETGITVGRWRRQARLLDALRQLASGQTVKVVAQDAGYGSPSAFVSAFRSVFGVTPARYFDNPQVTDEVARSERALP